MTECEYHTEEDGEKYECEDKAISELRYFAEPTDLGKEKLCLEHLMKKVGSIAEYEAIPNLEKSSQ